MPEIAPLRSGDPRRLGAYRLTGLLGEGGQGTVYLGEDDRPAVHLDKEQPRDEGESARRVAVKLLHARFSGDPKARQRFAAELAVARRVAPFCTARILDSDVDGDRPYIVSEYIDGPSLSQVLATEGPRSGTALDRLAIGTMTALAAIHQAGVVHRDFKPGNVLLAPDGPRVIDFGIARALDAGGTMSSTAVGTPAYMAPEQISGAPVGAEADVFAWGATMVYAACGRAAFGNDTIPAVMHRILNLPPDLGALAEPLRSLVADTLAKDPARRPSSQQVLIRLLGLAGSLPQSPGAVLGQGAEAAVTGTFKALPPSAPPPPWAGPATPPPFPPPTVPRHGTPVPHQAGPYPTFPPPGLQRTRPAKSGGGKRPGVGVLVGAGSAALVALILVGTVIAVQLDDDPAKNTPHGRDGGQLSAMLPAPYDTSGFISPAHADTGTGRTLAKQLFTGLTEVSRNGELRNRLATGLTPDTACVRWTITIKDGTRFSNGEPVDAEAFARGWARSAQNPSGAASYQMQDVKGFAEVRDKKTETLSGVRASGQTLDVELNGPDCEFAWRLGAPAFFPAPRGAGKADDAAYNMNPVGNGPFKVQSYVKDSSVVLARNDSWAFGRARLDSVRIRLSSAPGAARTAFSAGEVAWAPIEADGLATSRPLAGRITYTVASTRLLVPLTARGPMASKEGRLAVSYALDRPAISEQLYGGAYEPAHGVVPRPVAGFGRVGVCASCDTGDPAKAKQLAEQAGLRSGTVVNLYTQESGSQQRLAEQVKGQLERALGWRVELKITKGFDYKKFRGEITGKDASGLAVFGWGPDHPTGYTMLRPLLGGDQIATASNDLNNLSGWSNPRFDELLAQALRTQDLSARTQLIRDAEKIALDEMALIPVLNFGAAVLRGDKYTGLLVDFDGDPTLATAALN